MRRFLFWTTSWIAIGLSACTTLRPPPSPLTPDTAKACAEWRWIGISQAGSRCPEIPGWTVRPLFPQVAPVQRQAEICTELQISEKVPGPELIQELNRFCTYEITNPEKQLKDLPFPPAVSTDLVRFDQDCAALSVSAWMDKAPDDHQWEIDFDKFLAQVGKPKTPLKIDNELGVRLAFLDTEPTGEGVRKESGNSPHGHALAHIARQLICTSDPYEHCAAQITTRLAMPIIKFNSRRSKDNEFNTERGGFIGMQSHLAEAIRSEVDAWRKRKLQQHLVLNLSLAWDGDLFSGLDEQQISEMKAGTQAVYRALQYAASFDVLVIAAAGNKKREPCTSTGPLLPAAWERGEPQQGCPEEPPGTALLYAVGGVRANGDPLGNARSSGRPLLATYAEKAVVPSSSDPGKPTAILTGSSVAAAVASSIAAIVWDTRPDLSPREVMDILYKSGNPLGFDADFWFGASSPPTRVLPKVHRLSLCAALEKACAGAPSCPVQVPCEALPLEVRSNQGDDRPAPMGTCQPWVYPQPEDPPCPNCVRDPPPPR
jgi:hypothetical protein